MSKNRKAADPTTPEKPDAAESDNSPLVTVVARTPIGEVVGGVMQRFAAGDTFQVTAKRADALGPLVEIKK
jgi:hypothetical protein